MNPQRHEAAAAFFSLLGAMFIWSSWAAQKGAPALHWALFHPKPAAMQVMTPEEKLKASQALEAAVKNPAAITKADEAAAKKAFGKDAERMLRLLKKTAR